FRERSLVIGRRQLTDDVERGDEVERVGGERDRVDASNADPALLAGPVHLCGLRGEVESCHFAEPLEQGKGATCAGAGIEDLQSGPVIGAVSARAVEEVALDKPLAYMTHTDVPPVRVLEVEHVLVFGWFQTFK